MNEKQAEIEVTRGEENENLPLYRRIFPLGKALWWYNIEVAQTRNADTNVPNPPQIFVDRRWLDTEQARRYRDALRLAIEIAEKEAMQE